MSLCGLTCQTVIMLDNCLEWRVCYSLCHAGVAKVRVISGKPNSKNNWTYPFFSNLYRGILTQTSITTDLNICRQPSTDGLFVILFLKTQHIPRYLSLLSFTSRKLWSFSKRHNFSTNDCLSVCLSVSTCVSYSPVCLRVFLSFLRLCQVLMLFAPILMLLSWRFN